MSSIAGSKQGAHPIWKYGLLLVASVLVAFLFLKQGVMVYLALIAAPLVTWALVLLYRYPKYNLYGVLVISFLMSFLGRYVPVDVPWSLLVDFFLIMAIIHPIIRYWHDIDFSLAKRSAVILLSIWMLYIILQLFNPLAKSYAAWFYAMRPIALYPLLMITSCLIVFNSKKDMKNFIRLWLFFSLAGVLWGIKQNTIGVSQTEAQWLEMGAKSTHLLFGRLRVFSYYFDAGTFGPAMGQIALFCFILFLGPFKQKRKLFFLIAGILTFYGMMISGTRGALAVPAVGAMAYLVMIRKVKLIFVGLVVLGFGYGFLKHTTIGQSNYTINRMRTALNPEDASLNVRFRNRALLTQYLQDKPFGGGLGTVGFWGARFSPGTWLADFQPDGLYTLVRAETGLIGRNLFVGILLFILYRGMSITHRLKDVENKTYAMAFMAGFAGIVMSNYGNPVMTQFPNITVNMMGLAFVYSMRYWNENGEVELHDQPTPINGGLIIKTSWGKN